MKNYDEMTDEQIDILVELRWIGAFREHPSFKPCSNPSHAWPIILENRIHLEQDIFFSDVFNEYVELETWTAAICSEVEDDIYSSDESPLRAAMICYLMMKDDEQ